MRNLSFLWITRAFDLKEFLWITRGLIAIKKFVFSMILYGFLHFMLDVVLLLDWIMLILADFLDSGLYFDLFGCELRLFLSGNQSLLFEIDWVARPLSWKTCVFVLWHLENELRWRKKLASLVFGVSVSLRMIRVCVTFGLWNILCDITLTQSIIISPKS